MGVLKIALSMVRRSAKLHHPRSLEVIEDLRQNGLPLSENHIILAEFVDGMSLIPWARSLSVACCLAQQADYVFIVDDDVWFRKEDVAALIRSKLPIVGLPVLLKVGGAGMRALNYSVFPGERFVDPDKIWRHIPRIGTGALLVKSEVFFALQKSRPKFMAEGFSRLRGLDIGPYVYDYFPTGVMDLNGQSVYVGEDFGFCIAAEQVGYPTFLYGSSITAHCVLGSEQAYICDMANIRARVASGELKEGNEAHAL